MFYNMFIRTIVPKIASRQMGTGYEMGIGDQ
jgi:hypothetical protein